MATAKRRATLAARLRALARHHRECRGCHHREEPRRHGRHLECRCRAAVRLHRGGDDRQIHHGSFPGRSGARGRRTDRAAHIGQDRFTFLYSSSPQRRRPPGCIGHSVARERFPWPDRRDLVDRSGGRRTAATRHPGRENRRAGAQPAAVPNPGTAHLAYNLDHQSSRWHHGSAARLGRLHRPILR